MDTEYRVTGQGSGLLSIMLPAPGSARQAVMRIDPADDSHKKLADLPVKAGAGPMMHDGRLYFTSDAHIWRGSMP